MDRSVIGSDHRADTDEKHLRAKTRSRDDGATPPVVAAANASPCSSKPGNTVTHMGLTTTLDSRTMI